MLDPETLYLVKREADRLQQTTGLAIRDAYLEAFVTVIMLAAETQAASFFEARILSVIDSIAHRQGGRPVSTTQLAVELGNMNRFTLNYHLGKLEARNLVCRPKGPKSGWLRFDPAKPSTLSDGQVPA